MKNTDKHTPLSMGVMELSASEIDQIEGGLSNTAKGLIFVGIGAAAVAAAPILGAGAVATFGIALGGRILVAGGGLLLVSR